MAPDELVAANPGLLSAVDFNGPAAVYPPRSVSEFMVGQGHAVRELYAMTADTIACYAPPAVALAVQDLLDGGGRGLFNFCDLCVSALVDGRRPLRSQDDQSLAVFSDRLCVAQSALAASRPKM